MAASEHPEQLVRTDLAVTGPVPDVVAALRTSIAVGFGLASLVVEVVLRALAEASPEASPRQRPGSSAVATDRMLGLAWGVAGLTGRAVQVGSRLAAPVVAVALDPPLLPHRWHPGHGLDLLAQRWREDRPGSVRALERWSNVALSGALSEGLGRIEVERQVEVALASVDVDAVVARAVGQLDLDQLTLRLLENLDLTRISTAAVGSIELDGVVDQAMAGLDLQPLVTSAVARLDLAGLIIEQVDLERIVTAALTQIDLTRIVLEQVDLIGVAEYVVEGIDLPEIIRDSTGSVASEAVRGLRMQGVDADAAVARVVDRVLLRRRGRRTALPALDDGSQAGPP